MPAAAQDVFVITAIGRLFSQRILTQFPYVCATPDPGPDQQIETDLLNQVRGGVGGAAILEPYLLALMTNSYVLDSWRIQKIWVQRRAYSTVSRNVAGTYAGTMKTPNTAASFAKRTVLSGRKYVGRFQIPGPPIEAQLNGLVDVSGAYGPAKTNFEAAVLTALATTSGGAYTACLFHKATPALATAINSCSLQDTVRTMHRRTVGLGE